MSPTGRPVLVDELRSRVRGAVWTPGDAGYDRAGRPWNLAVDQQALAVVSAVDADDVATVVDIAARTGTGVSPQPNGHGATGSATGTIVLRTGALDAIDVDPGAGEATIGAGVTSGRLQRATAAHGLTALPGSSPVVSVAGVALGGGLSWFGRAYGWVCDSVVALDVVDAEGARRTVDAATDPDLFQALRGGGGDHAVVTALRLRLHEAPTVVGGRMVWEGRHARAVAGAFREMTGGAPRELTLWLGLMHLPRSGPVVAIDMTHLGAEDEARELMAAVARLPQPLSDSRRVVSVAELGAITDEPTEPAPALARAELLTRLDDDALDTLVAALAPPLALIQVRHLGGALGAASDSSPGPVTEPYLVNLLGMPTDPAAAATIRERQRAAVDALPTSGRKPLTFLGPGEGLGDALGPETVERLRRIKTERDPGNVIRANVSALTP